jgi:hypothetical protein
MNLIKKEIKICGYDAIITTIAIFIFVNCLISISPSIRYHAIIAFLEICIPMIAAIKCAYILDNKSDMEIILCTKMHVIKVILLKYFVTVGTIILSGLLEIILFKLVYHNFSIYQMIIALIPTTLILSSISLFFSILGNSTGVGATLGGIIWLIQVGIGKKVGDAGSQHPWYETISFYNTFFKHQSSLWLMSKIVLLVITLIICLLITLLLNNRERIIK